MTTTAARPEVESPCFHARDGWTFQRMPDGAVRITCGGQSVTVDDFTWASAVCAVSVQGEANRRWFQALAFHNAPRLPGDGEPR